MSVFLLDTDTVTLAQFGHVAVLANLGNQPVSDVNISSVTMQEQRQGWLGRLPRLQTVLAMADWHDRLVNRMLPILARYRVIPLSEQAILRFEQLRGQRLNVGPMDLRIAAIALEHGWTVVTRNRRDFHRVPGLQVVDWST